MPGITRSWPKRQSQLLQIYQKTLGHCFYCNNVGQVIDHFIAFRLFQKIQLHPHFGNPNDLMNLFLACKKCNVKKGGKTPEQFFNRPFIAWDRYKRANKRIGLNAPIILKIIWPII